jgi:YegS/Rv2252/BmrU family lipid kinase
MNAHALLVSNSTAGSTTAEQVDAVAGVLRRGYDLQAVATSGVEHLRTALARFAGDHVIVAGGDGSLHAVVNVLYGLERLDDTVVGLIPMGTGNDFAQGLDLPDDPLAAAAACVRAAPTAIDLLVTDDGEVVVNAAHAGVGAVASDHAQIAKSLAGPLAYPIAAFVAGAVETGDRLEVTLDDRVVHDGTALLVLAANGSRLGGGAQLCAAADPADGLMDVLLIGDVARPARAGLGLSIQRGTHLDHDDVATHRCRSLRIRGEAVTHSRDGELRHELHDVTYTNDPGAWHLLR